MRFAATVLGLASLAPVFAHPSNQPRAIASQHSGNLVPAAGNNPSPCNSDPSPEFLAAVADIAAAEANGTLGAQDSFAAAATVTVQTYIHVIASSQTVAGGYVTASQIAKQFTYMNAAFASVGFNFVNAGTDYTINANWAVDGNELAMKKALRKGTYKDLNLYFQVSLFDDALGYCYFPVASHATTSANFFYDGCTVMAASIAGGTLTGYNLGGSATHETGHWLGLLHTFEGQPCETANDGIADTAAQNGYTSGCPASRDSCTSAGVDPIHNYMDYSTE